MPRPSVLPCHTWSPLVVVATSESSNNYQLFDNRTPPVPYQVCRLRLTVVSREAKKKQAVRDERVSYLHVALL